MNIVYVTIPRSFIDPFLTPQVNALNIIRNYDPSANIVLYSDDDGVKDYASNNLYHAPDEVIKKGRLPLVNEALKYCAINFPECYICYINSDMLLVGDTKELISYIDKRFSGNFLATGYRCNLHIDNVIKSNELPDLIKKCSCKKTKGRHSALDVFIFKSEIFSLLNMPNFPVGRPGWDNWLAAKCRILGFALVDISNVVTLVHQEHPSFHEQGTWSVNWPIWKKYGISHFASLLDCNYKVAFINEKYNAKFYLLGWVLGLSHFRYLRAVYRILRAKILSKI
jgi:hypothetical protein